LKRKNMQGCVMYEGKKTLCMALWGMARPHEGRDLEGGGKRGAGGGRLSQGGKKARESALKKSGRETVSGKRVT